MTGVREAADTARPRECPHIKPWTIKWGIAGGQQWCAVCKKYIYPSIDWDGHP